MAGHYSCGGPVPACHQGSQAASPNITDEMQQRCEVAGLGCVAGVQDRPLPASQPTLSQHSL